MRRALGFANNRSDRFKAHAPAALASAAFVFLAARLFWIISRYAVNIFFSDQWDFNDATLFEGHSIWQMFAWQQGPHRQGLGALFAKLVEPLFAWNSRTEAFVVGCVILVAAICALILKKRLYGSLSVCDVVIPAIFFTPGQYESLFVTANFAHGPLPLLLIVVYCLAWTIRRNVIRYSLILFINFVTIYTGFGLFIGVLTPILLVLDYWAGVRKFRIIYIAILVLVSVASFASFFLGYKFRPAIGCFSFQPQSPRHYLAYMAIMFAHLCAVPGIGRLARFVGIVILLALSIALLASISQLLSAFKSALPEQHRWRDVTIVALVAFCLLFCINTAYGRLCSGLVSAQSPRYVNYLALGVLGLYFYTLSISRPMLRVALSTLLVAVAVFVSLHGNPGDMAYFRYGKQRWKDCYLRTENVGECNSATGFRVYPWPSGDARMQEKLQYLKKMRLNLYADTLVQ